MIDRNGGTSMQPEALEARLFALPGPIAVSACLAGMPTRYDGTDRAHPLVARLIAAGKALPLCPEQIGGLPTPRKPYEIRNGVVIAQDGDDVTEAFQRGARSAVKLCLQAKVRAAVLQPRSPSCGCDMVYDGSFGGVLVPGHGVFAGMLLDAGIQVLNAAVFDTEASRG